MKTQYEQRQNSSLHHMHFGQAGFSARMLYLCLLAIMFIIMIMNTWIDTHIQPVYEDAYKEKILVNTDLLNYFQ